jgi:hypothetical protein
MSTIKNHERALWVVAIVITGVYFTYAMNKALVDHDAASQLELENARATHAAQVLDIRVEESKKIEEITRAHEDALKDIERAYADKERLLNEKRARLVVTTTQQFESDPRAVAEQIVMHLPGVVVK